MPSYHGNITLGGSTDPVTTIDLSSAIYGTGSTYTIGNLPLGASSASIYTSTGVNGTWGSITSPKDPAVKIDTDGIIIKEQADIKLGNVSLKDFIERIEQRLALLSPNPELEKEWEELKELGDQYRALEKHIKEKMKTWEILKREDPAS